MRNVHSNFKIGSFIYISHPVNVHKLLVEIPIDNRITLSTTIDKLRVFINKTLSTESIIKQLLRKRVDLSISIDSR